MSFLLCGSPPLPEFLCETVDDSINFPLRIRGDMLENFQRKVLQKIANGQEPATLKHLSAKRRVGHIQFFLGGEFANTILLRLGYGES
jgi:hypothetical protein